MTKRKMSVFSKKSMNSFASEYWKQVERLAGELRSQFASGELLGYRLGEDWEDRFLDARGCDPIIRLEERISKELVHDFETAYLILAISPSEKKDIDGGILLADSRWAAAECIVIDAFRLARERGWWKPAPDEYIGESEWKRLSRARVRRAAGGRRTVPAAA